MKISVTGGCGFLGSHLCERLLKAGHQLEIYDDASRGHNLPSARTGWFWTRCDLAHYVPQFTADVVFHLAAKVTGIAYNAAHHYEMLWQNTAINQNVAEAVRLNPPKLLVWVSTACVYPHSAPVPTPEECGEVGNPEPTNWGYGVAKWHGEQLAKSLCREYGIPTIVVRFFNAFGPRDYYDPETSHVAPALIKRICDGEDPVVVWGSGNQTRALVDARDIAKALTMLMDETIFSDMAWPVVVNVGHEREVSVRELAEAICTLSGQRPRLVFDASRPDGYPRRAADTTRLRNLIGWVPDMLLEVTLHDMIQEYRQGYQAVDAGEGLRVRPTWAVCGHED